MRRDGADALLEVRDTGIGIAPEDLPRVFTRFWRGEKSRSRDTGGAGIGLAIVKELVQAHGGEVTVESTPGEGSAFRVSLPLSAERAADGRRRRRTARRCARVRRAARARSLPATIGPWWRVRFTRRSRAG